MSCRLAWQLELRRRSIILSRMAVSLKQQESAAARVFRALGGWVAALALAAVLFASAPPVRTGAAAVDGATGMAAAVLASEDGTADHLDYGLACHMHLEHHQLVRSEMVFAEPFPDAIPAFYLTRVNPLSSREPYPLRKPPRA